MAPVGSMRDAKRKDADSQFAKQQQRVDEQAVVEANARILQYRFFVRRRPPSSRVFTPNWG